jgi:hypothetical protein
MEQEKKIAAAMAAVMHYLQSIQAVPAEGEIPAAAQQPPAVSAFTGLWALSGRQAAMQTRTLMQMKSFHGARLR